MRRAWRGVHGSRARGRLSRPVRKRRRAPLRGPLAAARDADVGADARRSARATALAREHPGRPGRRGHAAAPAPRRADDAERGPPDEPAGSAGPAVRSAQPVRLRCGAAISCPASRRAMRGLCGRPRVHGLAAAGRGVGGRDARHRRPTRSSPSARSPTPACRLPSSSRSSTDLERSRRSTRAVSGPCFARLRLPRDGLRAAAPAGAPLRGAGLPEGPGQPRAAFERAVPGRCRGRPGSRWSWSGTRAYWGPRGHFDRIVLRIVPDNTTAYRLLLAGELDEDQMDATLKARGEADPAVRRLLPSRRVLQPRLELHRAQQPLAVLRGRPRATRAHDALGPGGAIVRDLYRGSARVISGPWAPDSPAYDACAPAAARSIPPQRRPSSAEAGWRDTDGDGTLRPGRTGVRVRPPVSAGFETGRQVAEMLAAELARAGVTARVRTLEWAAFIERVDAGEFEAASLAWSAVDPNPDPYPTGTPRSARRRASTRLLPEPRGGPADGGSAARARRVEAAPRSSTACTGSSATTRPSSSSSTRLRNSASTAACGGSRRRRSGLSGIWPGPVGLVRGRDRASRLREEAGGVIRYVAAAPAARGPDALRNRRRRLPAGAPRSR